MFINKGKDKFMMLDINADELMAIYDAFNSGKFNMTSFLSLKDEDFALNLNCKPEKVQEMRKFIASKIAYYDTWLKKLKSYGIG